MLAEPAPRPADVDLKAASGRTGRPLGAPCPNVTSPAWYAATRGSPCPGKVLRSVSTRSDPEVGRAAASSTWSTSTGSRGRARPVREGLARRQPPGRDHDGRADRRRLVHSRTACPSPGRGRRTVPPLVHRLAGTVTITASATGFVAAGSLLGPLGSVYGWPPACAGMALAHPRAPVQAGRLPALGTVLLTMAGLRRRRPPVEVAKRTPAAWAPRFLG